MAEQAKVPEIRFAGFTDPWEQRKLGEVAHFINGRAYSQNELLFSGKYPVLRVGNFYTNDSWYYSNLELEDKNYAYEGDLLYTWSATFGPHIWHGNKVIYHYHIWKVQLEAALEKLFAFQLLERDKERILSDKNGSTMVHITKTGIENTSVLMSCSVEEQRRIGAFFDHLDSIITLHQRKYDKLVVFKKSMLEKMFPKDGESVPEIRFAGFTDPWEQRELVDIAEIVGGGTPDTNNSNYWDGDIDWYAPAELGNNIYAESSTRKITQAGFDSCSTKMLPADKTILFTSRAGIGNTAILRHSACTNQGFQSLVIGDADVYFVYSMSERIKKWAEEKASGSTFLEISGRQLETMPVNLPSLVEQQAIGSFFSHLDDLITLHQRKLELLQNIKKSLLDKMFA